MSYPSNSKHSTLNNEHFVKNSSGSHRLKTFSYLIRQFTLTQIVYPHFCNYKRNSNRGKQPVYPQYTFRYLEKDMYTCHLLVFHTILISTTGSRVDGNRIWCRHSRLETGTRTRFDVGMVTHHISVVTFSLRSTQIQIEKGSVCHSIPVVKLYTTGEKVS